MANWKKVIIESDKLSALTNVGSSVASPSQNETLIFDGTDWQAAPEGTEYNFSIASFTSPDGLAGDFLQGEESTTWKTDVNFTASYNNLDGDLDENATVALTGDTGVGQAGFPYDMGADGAGGGTVTVKYPVADWSASGYQYLQYKLTAKEGGTTKTSQYESHFYNYKAWGIDEAEDLDATGTSSGDVFGLHTIDGNVTTYANYGSIHDSYLLPLQSSLAGTGYIHYCYPSRITGTPTFWISGLVVAFTLQQTFDVTNTAGYEEEFKHWISPQSYTGGDNSFQVT